MEYTKQCIESVEANTNDVKCRYIFVDNHSTDGTVEYLKTIPNSILISNPNNIGFAKAMNQAFDRVSSKYVVWLNNDTIVTPGWLHQLIKHLEDNPKAVAIGPVSNGTGKIQLDDSWYGEINPEKIAAFAKEFHRKHKGRVFEYHRVAGFCIVMKSDLIAKIGKLGEQFNFGGYDDDDYCKRIRDAGYKILIAEDVFIYHKSGATFSATKDPDLDLAFLMQKGRRAFLKKWATSKQTNEETVLDNTALVSIIMATKNREKIIPHAINAVINQSYKNWELIVVNDGGADIKEVIMKFSDPRIKYINLESSHGKSYANNMAIKQSKGEIMASLDDDDRWLPNHLQVAVKELTRYDSRLLVYTDYIKVYCMIDDGKQVPIRKYVMSQKEASVDPVSDVNFIPNLSVVHRKSLFQMAGVFDEKLPYYEDWDLLRRFSRFTYFVHVPEVTCEYWINQSGSSVNVAALLDNRIDAFRYIRNKEFVSLSNPVLTDLDMADKLRKSGESVLAIRAYQRILQKDPEHYPSLEGVANCFYSLRKYEEAERYFRLLRKTGPYSDSGYLGGAKCLIKMHLYEEAMKLLQLGLIISDDESYYYLLRICHKKLGNARTVNAIKRRIASRYHDIEAAQLFLRSLYEISPFYRELFRLAYRIIRKIAWAR